MKRIYHILALISLINLFAMGGLAGFLFSTGRLNAQRLDQIGAVLRGDTPVAAAAPLPPATQPAPEPPLSRAEIARLQAQKEYFDLLSERSRQEIEQRRALNQQIQLDVTRQLEELEARRQESPKSRTPGEPDPGRGVSEKELEWFGSIDPRKSKELLIQRKDPDAARILMELEPSRVKKIVDACKTPEEMSWIGRILNQIREMDTAQANGVDGPGASSK